MPRWTRLSFAGGNFKRPAELHASVMRQLAACERRAGLPASHVPTPAGRFADLLEALHDQTGERVVVLVDEYDKPILDALEGPAPAGERSETPAAANAQATAKRDDLRGLYGTIFRVGIGVPMIRNVYQRRLRIPPYCFSALVGLPP